jgi:hypothetical protein
VLVAKVGCAFAVAHLALLAPGPGAPCLASAADLPGPELGAGVARPVTLDPSRPLYFHLTAPHQRSEATPGLDAGNLPPPAPDDSLTLRMGEFSLEIASAPPWFAPETVKLDYDLLLFRALSVTRDWVEVVVNESPERPRSFPRTAWVARESVAFVPWTEFLLQVYSVEPRDPATNPLRSGPGASFPEVATSEGRSFHVIAAQGSWILVESVEEGEDESRGGPHGWLRWRDGDTLTVIYWLLS